MTKSKIVLVCINLLLVARLVWGRGGIIEDGTMVRLRIPTIDYPEYEDSQTIVKRGEWVVKIKGYIDFMPGDMVVVTGEYTKGKVRAETGEVIKEDRITLIDRALIMVSNVRQWAILRLQRVLPEPMASLAIGILLGVKREMPGEFYQALVKTGTLHIVAASGYNVAVVGALLMGLFGRVWERGYATGLAIGGIGLYVLLAGGSASIVRAGIMGCLSLMAYYWGRVAQAKQLLIVTIYIMLLIKPMLLGDIGWQLSVAATLGLMYLTPSLMRVGPKYRALSEYLYPTLAATIATTPIIWWHFGRVSMLGIFVNLMLLPVVPLVMLLATVTLVMPAVSYMLFVPLWWMVTIINLFG